MASLVACFLLELLQFSLLWVLGSGGNYNVVLILAGFGVIRLAITTLTGLIILYAILSWVQTQSVLSDAIERLCAPPLIPIRRVLPLVGGVDLSPLVLLLILQISAILLGGLQATILM
jgi:YggT family protein